MNFKSVAILDLETTNLQDPKITEICIIAAERSHILAGKEIPRATHKFSICVNPRAKIHPSASAISGLDNELLENVKPLSSEVIDSIRSLLCHLPGPVCLVAHNGIKFDFPIYRKELAKNQPSLSIEDIYVADSILFFRELFFTVKTPEAVVKLTPELMGKEEGAKKRTEEVVRIPPELMDEEGDAICLLAYDKYLGEMSKTGSEECSQKTQESTPKRKTNQTALPPKKWKRQHESGVTTSVKRALNFDESLPPSQRNKPKSQKLTDIYEYLVHEPMTDAHKAEGDCSALLRCICKTGEAFFSYIDRNAVLLSTIQPSR